MSIVFAVLALFVFGSAYGETYTAEERTLLDKVNFSSQKIQN